jgi:hypothetical protein
VYLANKTIFVNEIFYCLYSGAVLRINENIVTKRFVNKELIKKPIKRETKIKMGKSIIKNMGRN